MPNVESRQDFRLMHAIFCIEALGVMYYIVYTEYGTVVPTDSRATVVKFYLLTFTYRHAANVCM